VVEFNLSFFLRWQIPKVINEWTNTRMVRIPSISIPSITYSKGPKMRIINRTPIDILHFFVWTLVETKMAKGPKGLIYLLVPDGFSCQTACFERRIRHEIILLRKFPGHVVNVT